MPAPQLPAAYDLVEIQNTADLREEAVRLAAAGAELRHLHSEDIADAFIETRLGGQWRTTDIYTPGTISNVGMMRSEYLSLLARGSFEDLVAEMERRIERRRKS